MEEGGWAGGAAFTTGVFKVGPTCSFSLIKEGKIEGLSEYQSSKITLIPIPGAEASQAYTPQNTKKIKTSNVAFQWTENPDRIKSVS